MERVANEKAWSTNEFGVFDRQHSGGAGKGGASRQQRLMTCRRMGPGPRTLDVKLRGTERGHPWGE